MTINYTGGARNNHRSRQRRSRADVTGTPSYSSSDSRAVSARIATFPHTAAPRVIKGTKKERPPISFAFATEAYEPTQRQREWDGPKWNERAADEELERVDEDSPAAAELSFETQRQLLLDQPDWTSLPRDSTSSSKKPSMSRKPIGKSNIRRRARSPPLEPQLSPLPPLRDSYLRGSSVYEGNAAKSLASLPHSTPPRLPALPSPSSAAVQASNGSPSHARGSIFRPGLANFASPLRRQDSLPSGTRWSRGRSNSITSQTSEAQIVSLEVPPVKPPSQASPEPEILLFPTFTPNKAQKDEASPSTHTPLDHLFEPLPLSSSRQPGRSLPEAAEVSAEPRGPSPPPFSSTFFPNPYLATVAETMDLSFYPSSLSPSRPGSPLPTEAAASSAFPPSAPPFEDDLSAAALFDGSTLLSERMGLGCTEISQERAIELLLRERLLRRAGVCVETEDVGDEEQKEEHADELNKQNGGREPRGEDERPSTSPPPQSAFPPVFSTLSGIADLRSSSRSPQPSSFDLKSSLEADAGLGAGQGGGAEPTHRSLALPPSPPPASGHPSASQDPLASQSVGGKARVARGGEAEGCWSVFSMDELARMYEE